MFDISAPPPPDLAAEFCYVLAAACIILGAVLVLWGRLLGRAVMTFVGAGAGFLLAAPLTQRLSTPFSITLVAIVFTLSIMGLVTARALWALVAGSLGAGAGLIVLLCRGGNMLSATTRPALDSALPPFKAWVVASSQYAWTSAEVLWKSGTPQVLVVVGCAALVPLVLAMVWPRAALIVLTSLVGAMVMASGLGLAAAGFGGDLWKAALSHWGVMSCVAGILTLIGVVFQCRGARAASRAKSEESPADQEKGKTKPARAADKK